MTFRRGFKTEAEDYAAEFRSELGLENHAPLCPWTLADHLAITVIPLREFSLQIPNAVRYLKGIGKSIFSAATVFSGRKRLIVHNDAHHPWRQASNISHELSHGILGHPPTPPLDDKGCRNFDKTIEAEANWLGAALLVPRPAALHIVQSGMPIEIAKRTYGASGRLITWRINATGVKAQIDRAKRFYHRRRSR